MGCMVQKLPDVCHNVGFGVVLLDDSLRVVDINRELQVKGGITREMALGKNFLDFIPPEKREKILVMLKTAREVGSERGIVDLVAPSGKRFWLYLRFTRMGDGFVVTMVDISRMVSEQRSLVERNDELEMIHRFVNAISGTLDLEEIYEMAYRELSNIVSSMDAFVISIVHGNMLRAEFVVGKNGRLGKSEIPLNDRDTLSGWVAVHRRELYVRNVLRENLPAKYRLLGHPVLSWLGIPLIHRDRVLGVMSVQSERENAFSDRDVRILRLIARQLSMAIYNAMVHRDLRKREEMYRALVNNSLMGIVVADPDLTVRFVNNAMARMLGYTREEIIGRKITEFATERSREVLLRRHRRRLQGLTDTYETELVKKSGERICVMIYASPLRDDSGNITGTMAAVADITPLKNMQRELLESKEFLELLLHVIGHDLKTPLAVISGYTELLREDFSEEYLDEIEKAVERAQKLISDVRLLLRLNMGDVKKDRFTVREVIEDAIKAVKARYREAKIIYGDGSQEIMGNRMLIREALTNIILNSFKYGATEVRISSEVENGKVFLRIEDNGPGISEEIREKVFRPFVKSASGGSGLGLYIVKRIVEMHRGCVKVENLEPHGTVFTVELPINAEE